LIAWRADKPSITFSTEASINLADDETLKQLLAQAGFTSVFIGIETPDENSLASCQKKQNLKRDLIGDVRRIIRAGLQVQGGFSSVLTPTCLPFSNNRSTSSKKVGL